MITHVEFYADIPEWCTFELSSIKGEPTRYCFVIENYGGTRKVAVCGDTPQMAVEAAIIRFKGLGNGSYDS